MMLKAFMCLNYLALKIQDYIINFTFEKASHFAAHAVPEPSSVAKTGCKVLAVLLPHPP